MTKLEQTILIAEQIVGLRPATEQEHIAWAGIGGVYYTDRLNSVICVFGDMWYPFENAADAALVFKKCCELTDNENVRTIYWTDRVKGNVTWTIASDYGSCTLKGTGQTWEEAVCNFAFRLIEALQQPLLSKLKSNL